MKRLRLTMVVLVCAVAGTASAESLSVPRAKLARPHAAKTKALEAAPSKSASLGGISFSDPYAPPVGVPKTKIAPFPAIRTDPSVDPQGGFSLTAGRDSPDAPFTGGLKFRF
jgi:hypothetical protein